MRRFFKWLGIGVGVLAVAIAGLVFFWDWNWFREYANRTGTSKIGRTFSIGNIDVDMAWVPRITLDQVKLGNADWSKDKEMIDIGRLDFTIELAELLRGRVVLPELAMVEPKIRLERKPDGTANWEISPATASGAAVEATVPEDRTEFPIIGRLQIEKGTISYKAPADKIDLESTISTAMGAGGEGKEEVRLEGKGSFAKEPFTLKLRAGSILSLRDNDKPYPVNVDARIGRTTIQADGKADDPIAMTGLDFKFSVKGQDMSDLFPIFHIPLPQTPPYSLTGHLTNEKDTWHFRNFAGRMGGSDLSGDLAYTAKEDKRPLIQATLVSNKLDFDDLAGLIGATPEKGAKADPRQQAKKQQEERDGRVLPSTPIDLSKLRAADMDVRFQGKRILYPELPLDNMDARFKLTNGRLEVEPLKFGVAGGTVAGSLMLDGRKEVPAIGTNLTLRNLELKSFFGGTEQAAVTAGRFGGKVELAGSGKSVAQALGNADGRVGMSMAGGRISQMIIEASGIDIGELLPILLGKDQSVDIRCAVADFNVQQGQLKSSVLVFDTTDTRIDGEAGINLRDEGLNVRLVAHPKDPSPLTGRTPITVTGTLGKPQVGIDPSGLIARGAAAVALGVLLSPVAAILPLIELGLGEDSDCNGLLQQANAANANTRPAGGPARARPANTAPAAERQRR